MLQAVAKGGVMLAGSAIMVMLARGLGPEEYGKLGLIASLVATMGFINNLGLAGSVARYISDRIHAPRDVRRIVCQGMAVTLVVLAVTSTVFFLLLPAVSRLLGAPELTGYAGMILLLLVLTALVRAFYGIFQGLGGLDKQAYAQLLQISAYLTGVIVLVAVLGYGIRGALTAQSVGLALQIVCSLFLVISMLRALRGSATPPNAADTSCRWWPRLLRYGLPLFFVDAGFFIYRQSDILLIQYFRGSEQLSYYYIQYRVIQMLQLPAMILAGVIGPYFSQHRISEDRQRALFSTSIRLVMLFYFPAAVGLAVLADAIIVIMFGAAYLPGLMVFRMFAIGFLPFFALSAVISQALNFRGQAAFRAWVLGISAAVNIGLNMLLIPRLGIEGAALATQLTYIPAVLLYIREICRELAFPRRLFIMQAVRVLAAVAGMLVVIVPLRLLVENHVVALATCVPVGALVYLALARLSGAWTAHDIAFLRNLFNQRRAPDAASAGQGGV